MSASNSFSINRTIRCGLFSGSSKKWEIQILGEAETRILKAKKNHTYQLTEPGRQTGSQILTSCTITADRSPSDFSIGATQYTKALSVPLPFRGGVIPTSYSYPPPHPSATVAAPARLHDSRGGAPGAHLDLSATVAAPQRRDSLSDYESD